MNKPVDGSNHHEIPSTWRQSSVILLVVVGLERLALSGIQVNVGNFFFSGTSGSSGSPIGVSPQTTTVILILFTKLPYIGASIAGTIADCRFGRYKVFLCSLVLQFVGSLCLFAAAMMEERHIYRDDTSSSYDDVIQGLVISGLILIALGLAGSSGTEIPLGVDQFQGEGNEKASSFFYCYYFSVNVAATISYVILSFIQVNYSFPGGISPSCVAYLAACLTMYFDEDV